MMVHHVVTRHRIAVAAVRLIQDEVVRIVAMPEIRLNLEIAPENQIFSIL